MGVLPDWMIKRDVKIEPFSEGIKREGKISYGLTSYGYDFRLGRNFQVYDPSSIQLKLDDKESSDKLDIWRGLPVIDPKRDHWKQFMTQYNDVDSIIIPPHSFALAESLETLTVPRDVLCIVLGKSTYARCATLVNVTPGEPEWIGKWTIELSNTSPLPLRVYAEEGIMQCVFIKTAGESSAIRTAIYQLLDLQSRGRNDAAAMAFDTLRVALKESTCQTSYKDKAGKYQDQTGLTLPSVDKHNQHPEGK